MTSNSSLRAAATRDRARHPGQGLQIQVHTSRMPSGTDSGRPVVRGPRSPGMVPGRNPLHQTGPVHKRGTNEQPASNQAREPGTADGDETEESAGQDGCAARDLNPEPAD
jgi:hypothetical protein